MKCTTHILYSGLAGSSTVAIDVMTALQKHTPQRAILYGVEQPVREYIDRLNEHKIPWQFVPKNSRLDFLSYFKLAKIACAPNSVIVLHGPKPPVHIALKICSPKQKTVIWLHSHENEFRFPGKYLVAISTLLAKSVICISNRTKELLAALPMCSRIAKRSTIITNSVDCDFWKPLDDFPEKSEELKLCFSGTLTARKRPQLAIEVLQKLLRKNINATLTICGHGPMQPELIAQAKEIAPDKIIFKGMLNRRELLQTYQASDMLIHTSEAEGMSISVLEALAAALPVVGLAEGLQAFKNLPCIVKTQNTYILAESIEQLWNEPEKLQDIKSQARQYILEIHNLSNKLDVIEQALSIT